MTQYSKEAIKILSGNQFKRSAKRGGFVQIVCYEFTGIDLTGSQETRRFFCKQYTPYSSRDRVCQYHPDFEKNPRTPDCPKMGSAKVCYGLIKRVKLFEYFEQEK